jgi:signal transduction histidine kinase
MLRPPIILIFFLFLICRTNAQDSLDRVFHISQIPQNGLVLDSDWVYKSGDDPERSKPEFNDKDWTAASPADEWHHLPEVQKSNIGWFRLKLKVDSTWLGKSMAILLSGLGAEEVYLNGKLIYKYGRVSANYNEEQTRFFTNDLLSLELGDQPMQTIAIRHSFNKKNLYLKFSNEKPIARIVLKEINQGFSDHIKDTSFDSTLRTLQVSFYLPLGFLLLFLFFSFRLKREYLYSGIFCFCLFIAILFHILALSEPTTVSRSDYLLLVTQVFYVIGCFCFINAVYILYNLRKNFFYYIVILYGLWSIPFYFLSYDSSGLFNAFFFPVINLEFLRLSIQAVRRGRKGAWILLTTSIAFAASICTYIWFNINGYVESSSLFQCVSFMIPGIGFSFFYASEFARNSVELQVQAIEVKKLSDEMIEKEREKQQILSSQNETLEKLVAERTAALRQSLKDLRDTEQQLIQREKMASLGELTAGIAHEIQNPLNFVNNFSEVNKELLDEVKTELQQGKNDVALHLIEDLYQNSEKINYHGKRADAIVKGMLQHSRSNSGQKEPIDINALAEECLQLSYHGLRVKDNSFNVIIKTDLDNGVGKVNVISREIGDVMLNLLNNAFYAVNEKKNHNQNGYEPTVTVTSKKANGEVQINIMDNGNGIPQKIIDKIFQPFFTTKPTGQGTGLGLSLSYDIITKGHGGEIKVKTKEGEGSTFIVTLPAN